MLQYLWRRLASAIVLVLLTSILVFVLMRLLPGNPALTALGDSASKAQILAYDKELGLNKPLPQQYFDWITGIVTRWNFGRSAMNLENISSIISQRLPNTILIQAPSVVFGVAGGLLVGIIGAVRTRTITDRSLTVGVTFFLGAPRFLVAIFGVLVLSVQFNLIPLQGYIAPWQDFGGYVDHAIWPVTVTAVYVVAVVARHTRSSLLEVMGQDYIRTARAYGLSERRVVLNCALKNALIPVITIIGVIIPQVVAGAVVVENIFNIPGIGQLTLTSVNNRDYFVVQACVFVISLITIGSNLAVDILYTFVDPRIRGAGIGNS